MIFVNAWIAYGLAGPLGSGPSREVHYRARGVRGEIQANLSVLRAFCGEMWLCDGAMASRLAQRNHVVERHTDTTFLGVHLDTVDACLDRYSNLHVDTSARSQAVRITSAGAGSPVHMSNAIAPCLTSIPSPSMEWAPDSRAWRRSFVSRGL